MAVDPRPLMSVIAFLDQTARKPNVKLDIMADKNPNQLNDNSAADARATPTMIGTKAAATGNGVASPKMSFERTTLKAGSIVFTVCVREIATAAKDRLAATCPIACMAAGGKIALNSDFVIGLPKEACFAPKAYIAVQ